MGIMYPHVHDFCLRDTEGYSSNTGMKRLKTGSEEITV